MEKDVNRALETASGMQYITRAECLGTGQSAENKRHVPVETGEESGTIPCRATTQPRYGSTQQQETQPVETVSQAMLGTTKTGKPHQRIQLSKEMNTFVMRQYYIITELETTKIGYRQELHDGFTRQYPEMDVSKQRIADQRRTIVTKNLLTKPWLEEIRAQVAETLKETTVKENDQDSEENINTDKETTQPFSKNGEKEKQNLESRQTVENPELDKIKMEFHKALKEFEGTDPAIRLQIPKQKCSRKLATIITATNQEILLEYMKNNVINFLELRNTIYTAAVATVRMSGGKIKNNLDYLQNRQQTPPWERRLKQQISDLRKDIGRVQQVQRGNTSNRIQKHMCRI
jgi:hypothetical protein